MTTLTQDAFNELVARYSPKAYYVTSELIPKFDDKGQELIYRVLPGHIPSFLPPNLQSEEHPLFMFHPDWLPQIIEGWAKNGIVAVDQRKVWEEERQRVVDTESNKGK